MADEALESALRALRHRDRSLDELDRRLAGKGFDEDERAVALETLRRTGLADDVRFAHRRAESLAARGAGDAMIRRALRDAGVEADLADEAIAALEPETDRAARIVARRGTHPKTVRYLHARGFAPEVVAHAVATNDGEELR